MSGRRMSQRKRDDNKNKICVFQGGGVGAGAERKIVQNAIFRGKRHDNKMLKVQILLSRNFVVMAQAPNVWNLQALSQTFVEQQFSQGNEGKDSDNLSSQTWPGSSRRPSPRHIRDHPNLGRRNL